MPIAITRVNKNEWISIGCLTKKDVGCYTDTHEGSGYVIDCNGQTFTVVINETGEQIIVDAYGSTIERELLE